MTTVGYMTMPIDFKYKKVHQMGRPRHEKYSDFWREHTPMDRQHRAKIFSPFDALKGYDEAIESKEVQYVERSVPVDLDEELQKPRIGSQVTISYFVPCTDVNNDAFDLGLGTYETITGTVRKIDSVSETLAIDDTVICFEDIGEISEEE